MSRATLVLVLIVVIILGGLVFLSRKPVAVAPHRIEKAVTLDGSGGGTGDAAK